MAFADTSKMQGRRSPGRLGEVKAALSLADACVDRAPDRAARTGRNTVY